MIKKKSKRRYDSYVSFSFYIKEEMKKGNGEDSFYISIGKDSMILSVFDGCGGIGARRYPEFNGKTGAYVSSNIVAYTVKTWYEKGEKTDLVSEIRANLDKCENLSENASLVQLKGNLSKSFPTTCAMIEMIKKKSENKIKCSWTGDSRCYVLDNAGLHQLTVDDVSNPDALYNLKNDGVLKNVICANHDFEIHEREYFGNGKFILFSASDGCFGYLKTPMAFEFLLLDTLMSSNSESVWKKKLIADIGKVAGDDYTMCLAAVGFKSFSEVKKYYEGRLNELKSKYMESRETEEALWENYKTEYEKY